MNVIDDIYDILAQNEQWATQSVKDNITALIDYVDDDRNAIVFRDKKGNEFELQLVKTYAPRSNTDMNRTELAQLLAGGYKSKEYNAIALMLNEVTDEQFKKFVKIYRKVSKQ